MFVDIKFAGKISKRYTWTKKYLIKRMKLYNKHLVNLSFLFQPPKSSSVVNFSMPSNCKSCSLSSISFCQQATCWLIFWQVCCSYAKFETLYQSGQFLKLGTCMNNFSQLINRLFYNKNNKVILLVVRNVRIILDHLNFFNEKKKLIQTKLKPQRRLRKCLKCVDWATKMCF